LATETAPVGAKKRADEAFEHSTSTLLSSEEEK
jgi:hypothetical protein